MVLKKVIHFTQPKIRDLPIPEKGRVDYYDDEVPKLSCRVSQTGKKSFSVVKWKDGKTQRVTLGATDEISVVEARKQALKALTTLNAGVSPTKQKQQAKLQSTKLVDVLEQYLTDRDLKASTVKSYRYMLRLGCSDWLDKPVSKITESMVLKRHSELTQKGKTTTNTIMRVLRLTLNYAEAVGMISDNPTRILSKTRSWHKNNRKQRVIQSTELKAWYEAVLELDNFKATVYLFTILYMGLRSNEALSLEWQHVNLKDKTLTVFDTKNRTDLTLPIPNILVPFYQALKDRTGRSKWVFSATDPTKHMWLPQKPIDAVIGKSGITFSSHDCRRTFATIAEAVNLPLTTIKKLMNHTTSNDVTGGYIITEEDTLRDAINKIADYIQARVTQQDNVVQLKASNTLR